MLYISRKIFRQYERTQRPKKLYVKFKFYKKTNMKPNFWTYVHYCTTFKTDQNSSLIVPKYELQTEFRRSFFVAEAFPHTGFHGLFYA